MSAAISSPPRVRRARAGAILSTAEVSEYALKGIRAEIEDARIRLAKARARVAHKRARRDLEYVAKYEDRLEAAYRTLDAFLAQIGDHR